jgi:hypothetical protein
MRHQSFLVRVQSAQKGFAMMDRFKVCIIENDLFVSEDMAHTVQAVLPSADCSVFTNVADARSMAEREGDPQLVLIAARAGGTFHVSPDDAKWLVRRKVIAFDARSRVPHPSWVHLDKPYKQEELKAAIIALVSGETGEEGLSQPAL